MEYGELFHELKASEMTLPYSTNDECTKVIYPILDNHKKIVEEFVERMEKKKMVGEKEKWRKKLGKKERCPILELNSLAACLEV